MGILGYIILFIILAILIYLYFKYIKILKLGSLSMVTGAVKSGKSLLSVRLVKKEYDKRLFAYNVRRFLNKYFFMKFIKVGEKPLIYSNIPLNLDYVPLTLDLLTRKERFTYGSVVYICEASLVADNSTYKIDTINRQLNYFCKLFGHETKGGCLIFDTQAIGDVAIGIRRCITSNYYVHHGFKGLFFHWLWLSEERYSEDGSVITTYDNDVEDNLKLLLIPKKTYKLYDRYCYSFFTDNKIITKNVNKKVKFVKSDLRAKEIISFREGVTKEL